MMAVTASGSDSSLDHDWPRPGQPRIQPAASWPTTRAWPFKLWQPASLLAAAAAAAAAEQPEPDRAL